MRNWVRRVKKILGAEKLIKLWLPRGSQIWQVHSFWSLLLESYMDWESLSEKMDLKNFLKNILFNTERRKHILFCFINIYETLTLWKK